jgi:hypothetical protein
VRTYSVQGLEAQLKFDLGLDGLSWGLMGNEVLTAAFSVIEWANSSRGFTSIFEVSSVESRFRLRRSTSAWPRDAVFAILLPSLRS